MGTEYSLAVKERAKKLRAIDDVLFRLIASRVDVCQEIIQTMLGDNTIKVIRVTPQMTMISLFREVILDVLCEMPDGTLINIEVQKGDQNDDVRRVRYHASVITVNNTPKGTEFADIPKVRVIYITEYDALNSNQTITQVTRCKKVGDEYIPVDDGEEILFANTVVKDDTDKSKLLQLFLSQNSVNDEKFPAFCEALKFYKDTEKGREIVCKIVEEYAKEYAEEYAEECVQEYKIKSAERLVISVNNFMRKYHETLEVACESSGVTVEEYYEAKELIEKAGLVTV